MIITLLVLTTITTIIYHLCTRRVYSNQPHSINEYITLRNGLDMFSIRKVRRSMNSECLIPLGTQALIIEGTDKYHVLVDGFDKNISLESRDWELIQD